MIDSWICLARIIKPDYKKKGLVLDFSTGPFFDCKNIYQLCGLDAFIVPPEHDLPWKISIDKIQSQPKNHYLCCLKGQHDYSKYFNLRNKRVMFNKEQLIELFGRELIEKTSFSNCINFCVVDKKYGKIGKVKNILNNPGQYILEIDTGQDVVMIPYVDQYIKDVTDTNIVVDIPQSLIDLNRS